MQKTMSYFQNVVNTGQTFSNTLLNTYTGLN